ncbi:MAG: 30S ribosomal protein S16 [Chlorobi bacterium]|nr:30S ribosomal protein S16 [Chlorobiota bacterium]
MPVRIRLQRHGRRKRPFYWIVVANSRAPRDGRFIEKLGVYDPNTEIPIIEIDHEKAIEWLKKGAQPSETAEHIMRRAGVYHLMFLLRGVEKGVHTREEAFKKFSEWLKTQKKFRPLVVEKEKYVPEKVEATVIVEEAEASVESAEQVDEMQEVAQEFPNEVQEEPSSEPSEAPKEQESQEPQASEEGEGKQE